MDVFFSILMHFVSVAPERHRAYFARTARTQRKQRNFGKIFTYNYYFALLENILPTIVILHFW
jgi:hypothetical protein